MAVETVRVYAVDELNAPLEDVLVRFFDAVDVFVTQQFTALVGGEAYAEVSLDGNDPPIQYTIRLSKTGVAFDGSLGDQSKTPQSIDIYSPPAGAPTGTNYFEVQGQTFTLPAATDPRLCRCSGYFVDHTGRPLQGFNLHFSPLCLNLEQSDLSPLIVDDRLVAGRKVYVRTDEDGFCQIDLFRTGEYLVLVEEFEHSRRTIKVPDQASINLIHLLFPVVSEITFGTAPVTVAAGSYVDVAMTVKSTDGQTLDISDRDVTFASSDYAVASAQTMSGNILRVVGVAPGSTTITAERADTTIVTIPAQPLTYTPLNVVVT